MWTAMERPMAAVKATVKLMAMGTCLLTVKALGRQTGIGWMMVDVREMALAMVMAMAMELQTVWPKV